MHQIRAVLFPEFMYLIEKPVGIPVAAFLFPESKQVVDHASGLRVLDPFGSDQP